MGKRLQINLSDNAWGNVLKVTELANTGFTSGKIKPIHVIEEMILTSNVNIEKLQLKRTDLKKSLRTMASNPNIDVDQAMALLQNIKKNSTFKKKGKATPDKKED